MSNSAPSGPRVLIICSDLFFATQLRSAAERAGTDAEVEMQLQQAIARMQAGNYGHIVVDLEAPGLDLSALLTALPDPAPRVIAFGPHVQERRLAAAREAGCSRVVTRGQISTALSDFLTVSGDD